VSFKKRFSEHKSLLKNNRHNNIKLQNVANKYGIGGFVFKVVENCKTEDCLTREQYWIDKLNVTESGYNISKVVSGVSLCFEDRRVATKRQQKIVYQINKYNKIVNIFSGIHEAGRKTNINSTDISRCCNNVVKMAGGYLWIFKENYNEKIKYSSRYNNKGVLQYDKDMNFIKKYNTMQEAANLFANGKNGNISKSCNFKIKSAYGFIWRYEK
jgi:group I intron endonuclease